VWEEAFANVLGEPYAGDVLMAKADCTGKAEALCRNQVQMEPMSSPRAAAFLAPLPTL
jgi:hypothetical protein